MLNFFINSRTAIAGNIIGLLLVFYDSKRSIDFLKVFLFTESTIRSDDALT